MKRAMYILTAIIIAVHLNAQLVELPYESSVLPMNGDAAIVDLNDDGLLDIIFSAGSQWESPATKVTYRFINKGNKTFTAESDYVIVPGPMASIRFADFDGNGEPDVVFSGIVDGAEEVSMESQGIVYNIKTENRYFFTPTQRVSVPGDFNNDGLVDYFCFGKYNGFYYNLGDGIFELDTEVPFIDYIYSMPEAMAIDWDNDGDLDVFITSYEVGEIAGPRAKLLRNDGNYIFTEVDLGVIPAVRGSIDFADLNGDGFLDIIANGESSLGTEAMNTVFIYLSDGLGGVEMSDVAFMPYYSWSIGDGIIMGDWDNDGKTDILVSGASGNVNKLDIYLNRNNGQEWVLAPESEFMPGIANGTLEVADFNNDNRLDVFAAGLQTGNAKVCSVYFNESSEKNEAPEPPTELSAQVANNSVHLSWNAGSDDKTPVASLSYSLYLKNKTTGYWVSNPFAEIGGTNDGNRYVTDMGNRWLARQATFQNLPEGEYEWAVQSVDASYIGSIFSTIQTFTIPNETALPIIQNRYPIIVQEHEIIIDPLSENVNVRIYSISGLEIYSKHIYQKTSFPLSHGTYIVNLTNESETITAKILL